MASSPGNASLSVRTGHANMIGHVERVPAMAAADALHPAPLATWAPRTRSRPYAAYDRHEPLTIVLEPSS
ncbi:hypothetical protein BH20ACT19_BH20ACT19_11240 [soil metagenome]